MKIRKGSIVKVGLASGEPIGMVVYRKSNEEIGVNSEHYRIAMATKDKVRRENLLEAIKLGRYGFNIDTGKDKIKEVITY